MKSYFRFLSRNKLYTFINIAGLVVSLMFIILMGDYTWRQYSIDSWHKNADRIYLVGNQEGFAMWPEAVKGIRDMCPEVEQTCCVLSQKGRIKYGQQEVTEAENEHTTIMLADSTFFQFFDFPLLEGDRLKALDAPDKCVITERLARRLFGDKDPIGESLQIVGECESDYVKDDYDSTLVYTVSAVVRDLDHTVLPNETQVIASMERYPQLVGYHFFNYNFAATAFSTCKAFFMLRPGMTLESKKKTIDDYIKKNFNPIMSEHKTSLTALKDVMFAPQNNGKDLMKGDKLRLHILLAAVLILLFFAITNYINLTIANTGFRAKEMATRKLFGSSQLRVSLKLILESTLMVTLSFVIGLFLAICLQDDAANLFRGKISLLDDINLVSVSISLAFILLTGVISGILPSFHLSRYQPIDIVKGSFRYRSKMVLGKMFIILQNIITVTMLTSALVIWLQLNHLIHAPLGFNTENLYMIYSPEGKNQTVRNQLEKLPFVEKIGACQGTSFTSYSTSTRTITKDEKMTNLFLTDLDSTAFNLYGLEILQDYGPTNNGYYLTEEAMRRLEYTEKERIIDWGREKKDPIAGILKDFHRINVLQGFEPFAIRVMDQMEGWNFLVKTNGDKQAKAAFEEIIKEVGITEKDVKWYVSKLDDSIAETFEDHQNTLKIITLFTIIAVIISVMGYVGMSLFFIRQRQKEIGIRKIMGSSSREVMILMLRTFCAPLLLSFVIAIPLSWYIMNDWLTNFSYRISLSPWIFAATCAFALLVAVLSVGFQIIKAVRTNPVESIKTE